MRASSVSASSSSSCSTNCPKRYCTSASSSSKLVITDSSSAIYIIREVPFFIGGRPCGSILCGSRMLHRFMCFLVIPCREGSRRDSYPTGWCGLWLLRTSGRRPTRCPPSLPTVSGSSGGGLSRARARPFRIGHRVFRGPVTRWAHRISCGQRRVPVLSRDGTFRSRDWLRPSAAWGFHTGSWTRSRWLREWQGGASDGCMGSCSIPVWAEPGGRVGRIGGVLKRWAGIVP